MQGTRRRIGFGFASLVMIFLLLLVACAPQAAPTPIATSTPGVSLPKASPAISPEDVAWAKVMEAAKKEGKVTAYAYSWVGDIGIAIQRAFESKYGIKLDIITGRGAEFLERIKTEKRMRQQVADVTEGSSLHVHNMRSERLLVSIIDELPSLREKGVWLVEPTAIDPQQKANLALRLVEYTPYINTKLVKKDEIPNSWKDLLNPKWKGKITLMEPNISATGPYQAMVVLFDNKVWDEDYIRALYRQDLHFPLGEVEELRMLAAGESSITTINSCVTAAAIAMQGAPIQAIDMREGVLCSTGSVGAIAGGPNPNAVRVFINWLYSHEGQSVAGEVSGQKMLRKDVPDSRPKVVQASITRPLVITPEQLEKATVRFREKWFDKIVGR